MTTVLLLKFGVGQQVVQVHFLEHLSVIVVAVGTPCEPYTTLSPLSFVPLFRARCAGNTKITIHVCLRDPEIGVPR